MSFIPVEDQQYLLRIARESIQAALQKQPYQPIETLSLKEIERGLFVTLRKQGELRGCLGRFEPDGLPVGILTARLAAETAMHDNRFERLRLDELPWVDIHISILSVPQRIENVDEILVGKHGLKIQGWTPSGQSRMGTLLPQVAVEQNWDAPMFLSSTCVKAGLHEDAWRDPKTEIYTYEAQVFGDSDFGQPPYELEK